MCFLWSTNWIPICYAEQIQSCTLPTECTRIYVSYVSQKKLRLFLYTALTDWSSYWWWISRFEWPRDHQIIMWTFFVSVLPSAAVSACSVYQRSDVITQYHLLWQKAENGNKLNHGGRARHSGASPFLLRMRQLLRYIWYLGKWGRSAKSITHFSLIKCYSKRGAYALWQLYLYVNVWWPTNNIAACLLKARTVKPAETSLAREWLCKHARC
jgi:hypothetical protein